MEVTLKEKQGAMKVQARDKAGNDLEAEVLVDGQKVGTTPGTFKVSMCARGEGSKTRDDEEGAEVEGAGGRGSGCRAEGG